MRVIDAYKVQLKLFEESKNIRYFDKNKKKSQIFADGLDFAWTMLDNAPTVDAIPIEWINKWIKENTYADVIDMVRDWEKENE